VFAVKIVTTQKTISKIVRYIMAENCFI